MKKAGGEGYAHYFLLKKAGESKIHDVMVVACRCMLVWIYDGMVLGWWLV